MDQPQTVMTSKLINHRITNIVLNDFTNDSRVLKMSRSLAGNGFDVRVIALHDGDLPTIESFDGFKVHRLKLWSRVLPRKRIFHVIKYLEFNLRVLLMFRGSDAYHCNDLHTLPVGFLLKLFSFGRTRIVYDAHEYECEANGVGKIERKLRKLLEGSLIGFADRVITVSDSIANEYVRLYSIEKPQVVLNIPMLTNVQGQDLFRNHLNIGTDKKIFLYQGGLTPGRGIEVLLDAFDREDQARQVLVVMGYGPLEQEIKMRAAHSSCIYFHPAVAHDDIPNYTSSADVGISTIENTCLSYYYCLPNKLFEYLMAEIPVIVSNMFEMKKIVEQYGVGVVAEENSPEGIRMAVSKMDSFDSDSFATSVKHFNQLFNWQSQEKALISLYHNLLVDTQ